MPLSIATVITEHAHRYLLQLTKHFAHKIQTWQQGNEGELTFPMGACALRSDTGTLTLLAAAPDDDALAQTQDVVARHLVRFAFREDLVLSWSPTTADKVAEMARVHS